MSTHKSETGFFSLEETTFKKASLFIKRVKMCGNKYLTSKNYEFFTTMKFLSFTLSKRAPPDSISLYKLSIQIFKLYNAKEHSQEWVSLIVNQILIF